jgi:hypothetical protein
MGWGRRVFPRYRFCAIPLTLFPWMPACLFFPEIVNQHWKFLKALTLGNAQTSILSLLKVGLLHNELVFIPSPTFVGSISTPGLSSHHNSPLIVFVVFEFVETCIFIIDNKLHTHFFGVVPLNFVSTSTFNRNTAIKEVKKARYIIMTHVANFLTRVRYGHGDQFAQRIL